MKSNKIIIKFILLITIFLIQSPKILAQKASLVLGESLEDENEPEFIDFIGSDNSGIYFFKHGEKKIYYIEKYDLINLKLVYRCILPNPFKDKVILTSLHEERSYYTFLNNGIVDVLYLSQDKNEYNFHHNRVSEAGIAEEFKLIYTEKYNDEINKKRAITNLSSNGNYLLIANLEEKNKLTSLKCLKIKQEVNSFSVSKQYQTSISEPSDLFGILYFNIFNDGRIGVNYTGTKNIDYIFSTNSNNQISNTPYTEIFPNSSFKTDFNHNIVSRIYMPSKIFKADQISSKTDTNLFVTVYDSKQKNYAFTSLIYNRKLNKYEKDGVYYLDNKIKEKLGKFSGFDDFDNRRITFLKSIETEKYNYKLFSENFLSNAQTLIRAQGYLIALKFDKSNKMVDQFLIPSYFIYMDQKNYDKEKALHLTDIYNFNFGIIEINNELVFLSSESKDNLNYDLINGKISDFERLYGLNKSYMALYKTGENGILKKLQLDLQGDYTLCNIVNNNFNHKDYQYVYVINKKKRYLGKIVIEK